MRYLIVLLMLSSTLVANSQNSLGLRLGYNFADVAVPNLIELENIISPPRSNAGGVAGILMNFPLSERVSIQAELSYVAKGFFVEEAVIDQIFNQSFDLDLDIGASTTFNYIEFAPIFKFKLGESKIKPTALIGPYAAIATNGHVSEEINFFINFTFDREDLNLQRDIYNRFEIGAIGGLGVQWDFKSGFMYTDLMFAYAFQNILENPEANIEMRNFGLRWGIGVAFHLGGGGKS